MVSTDPDKARVRPRSPRAMRWPQCHRTKAVGRGPRDQGVIQAVEAGIVWFWRDVPLPGGRQRVAKEVE